MLARSRTELIAAVIPRIGHHFLDEVLTGLYYQAAEHRHHVLVAMSRGPGEEAENIRQLSFQRRVDGMVVAALEDGCEEAVAEAARHMPVAVIGQKMKCPGVCSLVIDNAAGARAMFRHLLGCGSKRPVILCGPDDNHDACERLMAVKAEAEKCGIPLPEKRFWTGDFTRASGEAAVTARFRPGPDAPDAIFALNDNMALGARAALLKRGVRIPQDLLLAGFDDIETAAYVELSTLRTPSRRIGEEAGKWLFSALEASGSPDALQRILPVELVRRKSTREKTE
jgi:LacI family transcriptional regulator